MSQQLTLELSDEMYNTLQHQANTIGLSITDWIITKLSDANITQNQRSFDQDSLESQGWEVFALNNLNNCYSEDDPTYDLTHIQENNPDYERR